MNFAWSLMKLNIHFVRFFPPVGSTEDVKGVADSSKLAVKKPRPKASSPNRQGPQQCQVGHCGLKSINFSLTW